MVDYAVYGPLAKSVKARLAGEVPEFALLAGAIPFARGKQVGMQLSFGAEV
ncbi:hypothetical protein [Methylovorus mays]|uniref:hypothetical protein n=1 Tax=Methylovorus mays TaxID=184077 RepID=UPI001E4E7869|nr:hypothetical protein [Methylovorus mays]MCB5206002.1 hypothetical protein [Methylovorus mays]